MHDTASHHATTFGNTGKPNSVMASFGPRSAAHRPTPSISSNIASR